MTTDDLREKYGSPIHHTTPDDEEYFTDDYVLWLEMKLLERFFVKSEERIKKAIQHYEDSRQDNLKMAEKYSNDEEEREFYMDQAFELDAKIEELKWVIGELKI